MLMNNISSSIWQLQTAKNKFSEVVSKALEGKPQLITKNGRPAVYVISSHDYEALTKKRGVKSILLSSPHKELEISVPRQQDSGRDVQV